MKKCLSLFLCVALLLTLTIASVAETTEMPKRGGTLIVGKSADLSARTFDITHSNHTQNDCYVLRQIFETLINKGENGTFLPGLATSWEYTEDSMGLILKLREDVTYSNGEKFNAEAAAKVMNYYLSDECGHNNRKSDLALVKDVEVIDEYTIKINTTAPDAGLLISLTGNAFMLMSPSNIDNKDMATNPIGTGPFVLTEYVEGDHFTLTRRDDYYRLGADGQPLPYLDSIYYKILTDDSAKTLNLKSGDIDGVDINSSINSLLSVTAMENMRTYQYEFATNYWVGFNFKLEMLRDQRVRDAFSYAIDRQEIVDLVFEGYATVCPFLSMPTQWWYYDSYGITEYNPEKARALLAEAGYPDGISIKLSSISREPDNSIVQLLQSQMAEAGINLELDILERTSWVALVKTEMNHELCMGQMGNGGVSVNRMLKDCMVTYNWDGYEPAAQLRDMYFGQQAISDQAERKIALEKLQDFYHSNTLQLILCQNPNYCTFADYVKNVGFAGFAYLDFSETWLDK